MRSQSARPPSLLEVAEQEIFSADSEARSDPLSTYSGAERYLPTPIAQSSQKKLSGIFRRFSSRRVNSWSCNESQLSDFKPNSDEYNKLYEFKFSLFKGGEENVRDYIHMYDASDSKNDKEIPMRWRGGNTWEIGTGDDSRLLLRSHQGRINFEFVTRNRIWPLPIWAVQSNDVGLYEVPIPLRGVFRSVLQTGSERNIHTLVLAYREYMKPAEFGKILLKLWRSVPAIKHVVERVLFWWLENWEIRDLMLKISPEMPIELSSLNLWQELVDKMTDYIEGTKMTEELLRKTIRNIYPQTGRGFLLADKAFAIAEHFKENNEGREVLRELIAEINTDLNADTATEGVSCLSDHPPIVINDVVWPKAGPVCDDCLGLFDKSYHSKLAGGEDPEDLTIDDQLDSARITWIISQVHELKSFCSPRESSGSKSIFSRTSNIFKKDCSTVAEAKASVEDEQLQQFDTFKHVHRIVVNNLNVYGNMEMVQRELCEDFRISPDKADEIVTVLSERECMRLFGEAWSVRHIAMALTYIEFSYVSKILIGEAFDENYRKKKFPPISPNFRKWADFPKNLTTWVNYQIVSSTDRWKAAQKIECFTRIADICLTVFNWNSAFFLLSIIKQYQNEEYREIWRLLSNRTLTILNNLDTAYNNIHGEKRKGLWSKTSRPIGRTLRELTEKGKVAVVPVFYIQNRYATLTGRLPKKTTDGKVYIERYEEEWDLYADNIGRHRENSIWQKQLLNLFPNISMTVCKALAGRIESEVLSFKDYECNNEDKIPGELSTLEKEFKMRVIPKRLCIAMYWDYYRTFWTVVGIACHYTILLWWCINNTEWYLILFGAGTIVVSGIAQGWLRLRVERSTEGMEDGMCQEVHRCSTSHVIVTDSMTVLCSVWFWLKTTVYLVGLAIIPVGWRQRKNAQQREDWWSEGHGEIFEFSRCIAVYTFCQFFTILFVISYDLERRERWHHAHLEEYIQFGIILYVTVRSYADMFSVFYESIFKYDNYAYCLIFVDRVTDAMIRIYSLSIITSVCSNKGDHVMAAAVWSAVYLFEFFYVLVSFFFAKSEWKRYQEQDSSFRGTIFHVFLHSLILMQTSIANYIPIGGYVPRHPRLEEFIRHILSATFVAWYTFIIPDAHVTDSKKLHYVGLIILIHYLAAALFEHYLRSFFEDKKLSQRSTRYQSIYQENVGTNADHLILTPVHLLCQSGNQFFSVRGKDL